MSSLNDPIYLLSLLLQRQKMKKSHTKMSRCACFCAANKIAIGFGDFSCGSKWKSVDHRVCNLLDWQFHFMCHNQHPRSFFRSLPRDPCIHFMSKSSIAIGHNHHKHRAYFDVMVKINLLLDVCKRSLVQVARQCPTSFTLTCIIAIRSFSCHRCRCLAQRLFVLVFTFCLPSRCSVCLFFGAW